MGTESLLTRFCTRFGGQIEGAERRLLLKAVPIWKRPLWFVVDKWYPYAFEHDREAIREAGRATSMDDVSAAVDALHYRGRTNPNVWRNSIMLRVSGSKLREIAGKCFAGKAA